MGEGRTTRGFPFEVIGHRGCEGLEPGNSLDAIERAIALGIDRVEIDARMLSGGDVVLFHDARVGGKQVETMTRRDLLATTGKGERGIPLLSEALETCRGRIKVQLELKTRGMAPAARGAVDAAGFPVHDLHVSSFDVQDLMDARDAFEGRLSQPQLVYLFGGHPTRFVTSRLTRLGIGTISIKASKVNQDRVRALHGRGFRVIAFGPGDMQAPSDAARARLYRELIDAGLDGFTAAFPDVVLRLHHERKAH